MRSYALSPIDRRRSWIRKGEDCRSPAFKNRELATTEIHPYSFLISLSEVTMTKGGWQ